jgi:hypothetical protein
VVSLLEGARFGAHAWNQLTAHTLELAENKWRALQDSVFGGSRHNDPEDCRARPIRAKRELARPARLELATSWFVARRSIQLS